MRYHYTHLLEQLKLKRLILPRVGKDMDGLELPSTAGWNENCTAALENGVS